MYRHIMLAIAAFVLLTTAGCNLMEKSQVEKMQKMAAKIDQLDTELNDKEEQYRRILTQYGLKGDQQLTDEQWEMLELTPEQRVMLEERLQNEQDSSYATMIQEVLDMDDEVKRLRKEINTLRDQLPKPVVVQSGDNHYDLSMTYLIDQKGLDTENAQELVERANLLDYLLPGFEVWLFYDGGVFGTFVTQGTADQSPNQIKRYYKNKLVNERDKAQQQATELNEEVQALENRKSELLSQLTELETVRARLQEQITNLSSENVVLEEKNTEQEQRLNSVFYHVADYKKLKDGGIVGRFLFGKPQLKNFNAVEFDQSMDLRESDSFTITTESAGVDEINRIYVMPRSFEQDKDYKIDYAADKSAAVVYIINPEKFRMSRVLLAIR